MPKMTLHYQVAKINRERFGIGQGMSDYEVGRYTLDIYPMAGSFYVRVYYDTSDIGRCDGIGDRDTALAIAQHIVAKHHEEKAQ